MVSLVKRLSFQSIIKNLILEQFFCDVGSPIDIIFLQRLVILYPPPNHFQSSDVWVGEPQKICWQARYTSFASWSFCPILFGYLKPSFSLSPSVAVDMDRWLLMSREYKFDISLACTAYFFFTPFQRVLETAFEVIHREYFGWDYMVHSLI